MDHFDLPDPSKRLKQAAPGSTHSHTSATSLAPSTAQHDRSQRLAHPSSNDKAPEMISFSSVVILAWRVRLYVSVNLSSISVEFLVELSIACITPTISGWKWRTTKRHAVCWSCKCPTA